VTQVYRYSRRALAADYARGAAGLALCAVPLAFLNPAPLVRAVLVAGAALFLVYLLRTVARNSFRIEFDETGIRAGGVLGAEIRWESLCSVRLRYYTTRRDRFGGGGWMQLDLRGRRRAITVDSGLCGFAEVARVTVREARRRGHELDESTCANLGALGAPVRPTPGGGA
jgi:hypothetical protein